MSGRVAFAMYSSEPTNLRYEVMSFSTGCDSPEVRSWPAQIGLRTAYAPFCSNFETSFIINWDCFSTYSLFSWEYFTSMPKVNRAAPSAFTVKCSHNLSKIVSASASDMHAIRRSSIYNTMYVGDFMFA